MSALNRIVASLAVCPLGWVADSADVCWTQDRAAFGAVAAPIVATDFTGTLLDAGVPTENTESTVVFRWLERRSEPPVADYDLPLCGNLAPESPCRDVPVARLSDGDLTEVLQGIIPWPGEDYVPPLALRRLVFDVTTTPGDPYWQMWTEPSARAALDYDVNHVYAWGGEFDNKSNPSATVRLNLWHPDGTMENIGVPIPFPGFFGFTSALPVARLEFYTTGATSYDGTRWQLDDVAHSLPGPGGTWAFAAGAALLAWLSAGQSRRERATA